MAQDGSRPQTSSHPFDTDYGRHLGEKVVESVSLLKRMVATNTQLRATSIEAAEAASNAERSNAALMDENQQLRDRLEQMQELLVRSNSAGGTGAGNSGAAAEAERLMGQLSTRSYSSSSATGTPTSLADGGGRQMSANTASNPSWLASHQQQQQVAAPAPQMMTQHPGTEGMDPMLAAALYGPLPGMGGGSGAPPSSGGGRMLTAASLTADIGTNDFATLVRQLQFDFPFVFCSLSMFPWRFFCRVFDDQMVGHGKWIGNEASSLKAENDAMEQRLAALTQSLDGMSGGVLSSVSHTRAAEEEQTAATTAARHACQYCQHKPHQHNSIISTALSHTSTALSHTSTTPQQHLCNNSTALSHSRRSDLPEPPPVS